MQVNVTEADGITLVTLDGRPPANLSVWIHPDCRSLRQRHHRRRGLPTRQEVIGVKVRLVHRRQEEAPRAGPVVTD